MNNIIAGLFCSLSLITLAQFPPAANQLGTSAMYKDSSAFVNWATTVEHIQRGYQDISGGGALADHGSENNALGIPEGNSIDVVSLGDGGQITLSFDFPIQNGSGNDFAVFENGFDHSFLEFAHVEVSTDGVNFVRIPSECLIPNDTQTGSFGNSDPAKVHNLAGKYIQGYGTPFDLEDIADSSGINLDSIYYVRIIDVVGSISVSYGSEDAYGNIINDPFPTPYGSGGFDLDGIGVINENNIFASQEVVRDVVFRLFPNPSNTSVFIQFNGEHEVHITELSGKSVFSKKVVDGLKFDIQQLGLAPGIYLVQVGSTVQKLLVK